MRNGVSAMAQAGEGIEEEKARRGGEEERRRKPGERRRGGEEEEEGTRVGGGERTRGCVSGFTVVRRQAGGLGLDL